MGKKIRFSHFLYGVCGLIVSGSVAYPQTIEGDFKAYPNSVAPLPPPTGPARNVSTPDSADLNRTVNLNFYMQSKNYAAVEEANKQNRTLSPGEVKEAYSGSPEQAEKLAAWLKESGYQDIKISSDSKRVDATATIDKIQNSLHVGIVSVIKPDGSTIPGVAPDTPPKLPKEVAVGLDGIGGLQPWTEAVTHIVARASYVSQEPSSDSSGIVPRSAAVTVATYSVADVLNAYNATGIRATGKGQTVAILIDSLPLMTDITQFWRRNNLNIQENQIQLINVQGDQAPLPNREGEETLDAEWASGIAPGANVAVYAAGSLQFTFLDRALDRILSDALANANLRTVSISLGLREDLAEAYIQHEDGVFGTLRAIGTNVFVSSGDAGSNPAADGQHRGLDTIVEFGASDSNVIAVGGTTLTMDEARTQRVKEEGWSGSGGGVSKFRPRPDWQLAYPQINSTMRLVPDVSAVADPNPGALVIRNGTDWPVGGTSWSTPIWAGFNALLAEKRLASGQSPIGFLAPRLYDAGTRKTFHDITEGTNGAYKAGPGWNPVTGLGVPDLTSLAAALSQ